MISAYHVIRTEEILRVRQRACPGTTARFKQMVATRFPERTGTNMAEQANLKQYDGSQRGSQPVWQEFELTEVILRFSLLSDITQSVLVNIHRGFGNTCRYYLLGQAWSLNLGLQVVPKHSYLKVTFCVLVSKAWSTKIADGGGCLLKKSLCLQMLVTLLNRPSSYLLLNLKLLLS